MIVNPDDAKHLTDAQWLALIKIVHDNQEMKLTFPREEGSATVVERAGSRYQIFSDGAYHWESYGTSATRTD